MENVEVISPERVRHVALLARLELSPAEIYQFSRELTSIIHHLNKLGELNLDGTEPTSHPLPMTNVFRPDERRPSLPIEAALFNAPEREGGCFQVPQII
ncbi:Asp-tRNA(Asn)/Glu-tRNA(Gln) amidotransferase subunit GatC [Candidatus Poribacteria bacterium]|nr:Asp-tRNA(Asn)/Glu-tRNA(Gln) amidotransferase subunit GatC [Candidatus Poribacteria bacterium]